MNAIIAPSARRAILFDSDQTVAVGMDDPTPVRCSIEEATKLLIGDGDLRYYRDVDVLDAMAALRVAISVREALWMLLAAFDAKLTRETRVLLVLSLDKAILNMETRTGLADILCAEPFDDEADVSGARSLATEHQCIHLTRFLDEVLELQPTIRTLSLAWTLLSDSLLGLSLGRLAFEAWMARIGLYRTVAQGVSRDVTSDNIFQSLRILISNSNQVPVGLPYPDETTILEAWIQVLDALRRPVHPRLNQAPMGDAVSSIHVRELPLPGTVRPRKYTLQAAFNP